MKRFFCKVAFIAIPLLFSAIPFYGQVALVKNGKPLSRIVVASDSKNDRSAALLLNDFVGRISGCKLPVVQDAKAKLRKNDVVIGDRSVAKLPDEVQKASLLKEDGFMFSSQDGVLKIIGGGDKGSIYGVVTLLEKYFGVDYWGENEYSLTKTKTLNLPVISTFENPTFRYRQTGCYAARKDSIYKLWYRLEEPEEVFAGGLWVHTFDKLLPSDFYGKTHPEYFAYFNGKRHPGKASQWCLTNPEVFEIVAKRVDSIFKANPDKHIISISQNDGNYTNCTCDNCKAIDDR